MRQATATSDVLERQHGQLVSANSLEAVNNVSNGGRNQAGLRIYCLAVTSGLVVLLMATHNMVSIPTD